MILVNLLHKLVLRHSFGEVIYMPALVSESSKSLRADVFKEEKFKTLVIHGVKNFWLTDVHRGVAAPPTGGVGKDGGCGGDRDGGGGWRRGGL